MMAEGDASMETGIAPTTTDAAAAAGVLLPSEMPSSISTTTEKETTDVFEWTATAIVQSIALFGIAGVAEILGGWMVWMAIRGNNGGTNKKPWWYGLVGSLLLVVYGFIPCFQPTDNFGRIYAAYGGFFIVLSFLFGWALDGDRPDVGDVVGGCISLVGVLLILFWPRG
jgi:small multidrug resistance family-3 protein